MSLYLADLISDYFCPLSQFAVLQIVLDIIFEEISNLEVLHLENNKLEHLEQLGVLSKKFPELKVLNLNDNKVNNNYLIFNRHDYDNTYSGNNNNYNNNNKGNKSVIFYRSRIFSR